MLFEIETSGLKLSVVTIDAVRSKELLEGMLDRLRRLLSLRLGRGLRREDPEHRE